jgi:hypothetical protein
MSTSVAKRSIGSRARRRLLNTHTPCAPLPPLPTLMLGEGDTQ